MNNRKKIQISIASGLAAAIVFTVSSAGAANINQALSTLSTSEEWSIMAHAAAGKSLSVEHIKSSGGSATDLEKKILAITSQGQNPGSLVAELESRFDGKQIGDASLVNDDIFGILALTSAGRSGNITQQARSFILSNQNSDGGFSFSVGGSSDSNTTAMALAALNQTGSAPSSAISYLNGSKSNSGGYGFTPGQSADGASTAWAIIGLRSAGASVPSEAISFLENLQLSNGSFKWQQNDSSGSSLVTAYAVIALSGATMPIRTVSASTPQNPRPSETGEARPSQTGAASPSGSSSSILFDFCKVRIYHTDFPIRGGHVETIDGQLYFVKDDPQCQGSSGPTPTPSPTPSPNPSGNSSIFSGTCRVRIYHTDFPIRGGHVETIDGQLYFVKDDPECQGLTASPTPIPRPSDTGAATPSIFSGPCKVRIYHTDFPIRGGHVETIDGRLYFVKDDPQCQRGTSPNPRETGVARPSDTGAASPTPSPVPPPRPSEARTVNVSVSYPGQNIFSGNVNISSSSNALAVLMSAASQGGFSVDVVNTSLGQYVQAISGFGASGANGWQYSVNGSTPSSPAASFTVNPGDRIQWFYGPPNSNPF